MGKLIALLFVAFAIAMPASAAQDSHPCYGPKEKALARKLLRTMPFLGTGLDRQEEVARRVRNETCSTIALVGQISDIEYSYEFFGDSRNRAILLASARRGLDPLRVQAALVDLRWPPKMT